MCYNYLNSVKKNEIRFQNLEMSNNFITHTHTHTHTHTWYSNTLNYTCAGARNILLFNKSHNNFSTNFTGFPAENKVDFVAFSQILTFASSYSLQAVNQKIQETTYDLGTPHSNAVSFLLTKSKPQSTQSNHKEHKENIVPLVVKTHLTTRNTKNIQSTQELLVPLVKTLVPLVVKNTKQPK